MLAATKSIIRIFLSDTLVAYIRKYFFRGPKFTKVDELWLIEDNKNKIYVPILKRYVYYIDSIEKRINHMLDRYPFYDDLQDSLIIEVGAHIGEYTMAASSYAKKIICFEPDPIARKALLRNTEALENVEVLPIALSNKNKEATFYIATSDADSSLFKPDKYIKEIIVECRRLDDMNIQTSNYSKIFLKMDAEGFEPEVLEGCGNFLEKINRVSIDVSPERGDSDTYFEVSNILKNHNFEEHSMTNDMVLTSCNRSVNKE